MVAEIFEDCQDEFGDIVVIINDKDYPVMKLYIANELKEKLIQSMIVFTFIMPQASPFVLTTPKFGPHQNRRRIVRTGRNPSVQFSRTTNSESLTLPIVAVVEKISWLHTVRLPARMI